MRRLNVHPSLLPAYRGPAPIQHTIINDEKYSGVCVIEMLKKREGIDAGPVWGSIKTVCLFWSSHYEKPFTTTLKDVPMNVDFPDLRNLLANEGGKLLVSVLRDMIGGKVSWCPFPLYNPLRANSRLSLCLKHLLKGFHLLPWFPQTMPSSILLQCQRTPSAGDIGPFRIRYYFDLRAKIRCSNASFFLPEIETTLHPPSSFTISSTLWFDYYNGYVYQSSISTRCSHIQ